MPDTFKRDSYPIIAVVVDSGDFGYNTCGNCGYDLGQNLPEQCPACFVKLEGIQLSQSSGGSDF